MRYEDNVHLSKLLGMKPGEVNKYGVSVMELCDGNLRDCKRNEQLTSEHISSIIDQLVDTLEELKKYGKCHNDVKPGNVLYVKKARGNGEFKIRTKLADFGTCDKLGGTPGWSPPNFTHDRQPGYSDAYSFGLIALYLLTEDDELFYALRDNYIVTPEKQWLHSFRRLPEVKIIRQMMDPNYKKSSKPDWARLGSNIQKITRQRLAPLRIDKFYLTLQDSNTGQEKNK